MIMRWDIINALIQKNGYKDYLEIGVGSWENFLKIKCERKVAVDPNPRSGPWEYLKHCTSDEFFDNNVRLYDIIFIDGSHMAYDVAKDIYNGLRNLQPNGVLVLHDCNPPTYESQLVPRGEQKIWCGDVWRAFVGFGLYHPGHTSYCYDTDYGVGIIWGNSNRYCSFPKGWDFYMLPEVMHYGYFDEFRTELLGLIPAQEL